MNKTNNKQSVSITRENKEAFKIKRNPFQRIAVLINQYHSVDLMYATKEDKEFTKSRIKKDVYRQLKYVSNDIHSTIKMSLRSKDIWDDTKDSLL